MKEPGGERITPFALAHCFYLRVVTAMSRSKPIKPRTERIQQTLDALDKAGSDSLVLADSCLDETQCEAIARHIQSNEHLTSLDLRGNQLRGKAAVIIANAVGNSSSLRTLSMEWNSIGGKIEGVTALANAIKHHASLNYLDLRNNRIGTDGAVALATALRTNKSLLRVDLRWNGMNMTGIRALAQALEENRTLLHLAVSGNGANEESLQRIQRALARNQVKGGEKTESSLEKSTSLANEAGASSIETVQKKHCSEDSIVDQAIAIPDSLEGAILCIRNLEDSLHIARSKLREEQTKNDVESRAHSRCRKHLEEALEALEKEKLSHSETATTLNNAREDIAAKLEETKKELRLEKDSHQEAHIKHKAAHVELHEKVRFVESKHEDALADVGRAKSSIESLEKQVQSLHAQLHQNQEALTNVEEGKEKAVSNARMQAMEQMHMQLTVAEKGRVNAEERRNKMEAKHDSIELELNTLKATVLADKLNHQKALEQLEEKVRSEMELTIGSSIKQLEAQLKAVEVSHERMQTRNSEEASRFALAQGRAAEQLVSLQEAVTEEVEKSKALTASLKEANAATEEAKKAIVTLQREFDVVKAEKETQDTIHRESTAQADRDLEQLKHNHSLDMKRLEDLMAARSSRILEVETALREKDEEIRGLTLARNEDYKKIEKDIIVRVQNAFVSAQTTVAR